MDSDIDEMVECRIVKRHIVGATIKLVLVESYQTPMINQVVVMDMVIFRMIFF